MSSESTGDIEEYVTEEENVYPDENRTATKQVSWKEGPAVLINNQFPESEDSEEEALTNPEAELAAVKVVGPLTDTTAEDVLVPQIPNKGSHAFIRIYIDKLGPCSAMMDSGSEVNVIRLSFMENKGHPYSISSSTRTLSCASGASMHLVGMCYLDVTIQGQTTEKLQFYICHW